MMPRTLLAFAAAVVLMLVALASPTQREQRVGLIPLDLQGITEIEVRAPDARIELGTALPSAIEYRLGPDHAVTATRQGTRLLIVSNIASYPAIRIRLPATVARLVVSDATIEAEVRVDALVVEVGEALAWNGDAGRLQVIHTGAVPAAPAADGPDAAVSAAAAAASAAAATTCGSHCKPQLQIHHGRIERLDLSTARAHVSLQNSDDIGHAQLDLGAHASFALGQATRLDNIHLGASAPPAVAPAGTEAPKP